MPYIELSGKRGAGLKTLVDEDIYAAYGHLSWFLGDTGYAMRRSDKLDDGTKVTVRLHRLVVNAPEGLVVDHKNHDKLDNRRSNLRAVTQAENARNYKGAKGYAWDKSRSRWIVRYRGSFYGRYRTESEAQEAYKQACSGVPYRSRIHPRRKYLPPGVSYMKGMGRKGYPAFYIRTQNPDGTRKFRGFFRTAQEAEAALQQVLEQGG